MKYYLFAVIAVVVSLIFILPAQAQQASFWLLTVDKVLKPVNATWGLNIPSLSSAGSPCISVTATGTLATTTCGSGGGMSPTDIDTESELETLLTDVTNVFTNNDGTLADDNLTNNQIDDLSDVAALSETTGDVLSWNGSAWIDVATSTLGFLTQAAIDTIAEIETITGVNILVSTEADTEAELETLLTDVTNVYTNNDGTLADDNLGNNSIEDLSDVAAMTEAAGNLLSWNGATWTNVATSTLGFITSAITSFNGLTGSSQTLATTSSAGGWGFGSSGSVHTLNIPTAGAGTVLGLLSSTDWSTFNSKQAAITDGDALTFTGATLNFDGGNAPAGARGGTWASPTVDNDGHSHTGTTLSGIDLSDDVNLTAGDALTLTGDDIDFDGGTAPGGELGGTWASPTIDDSLAVTSWSLTTPTLLSFFGTPCTGNEFLQDISDTGAFTCVEAAGGGGGGGMSTSTDNNAETGETISYISTDFYVGGSASSSAEFNFDKDSSKLTISAPTNDGAFIGIGTTSSSSVGIRGLAVQGNAFISGYASTTNLSATGTTWINALRDSAGSLGTNGMVLQTNGSAALWVATSSLGFSASGGGGGLSTSTAIANTYMIYGTGVSTVGAEAGFTYNSTTDVLTIGNVTIDSVTGGATISGSAGGSFNITDQVYTGAQEVSGNILPEASGTRNLGSATRFWNNLFAVRASTTNLSAGTLSVGQSATTSITAAGILLAPQIGVGTSTPTSLLSVQGISGNTSPLFSVASSSFQTFFSVLPTGTTTISGPTAATSSTYIYSTAAGKGGSVILEDNDGAGCTEISALNGTVIGVTVTCPTQI